MRRTILLRIGSGRRRWKHDVAAKYRIFRSTVSGCQQYSLTLYFANAMSSSMEQLYDKSDYNCFIIVSSKDNRSIWPLLKHVISLSVQLSQVVGAISTVSSVKLSVKNHCENDTEVVSVFTHAAFQWVVWSIQNASKLIFFDYFPIQFVISEAKRLNLERAQNA